MNLNVSWTIVSNHSFSNSKLETLIPSLSLNLNWTGAFFDMFRFFLGGESSRWVASAPPCIFVVSRPITMKFCTGIDYQSLESNIKEIQLHKINGVIDNDVIILRPLSIVQKYTKQM